MQAQAIKRDVRRGLRRGERVSEAVFGFTLIAPLILWLLITIAVPLALSVYTSFTNLGIIGTESSFIGLENYATILAQQQFRSAFVRSLIWTFAGALLQIVLAFFAALALNQVFIGRSFARTWIILSWIVPTIVIAIIWRWMLNPAFGIINYLLTSLGLTKAPIDFLGSPTWALATVIIINAWRWFPFLSLLILAGLQSISHEYYEAAQVDGAGPMRRFFWITLPLLQPVLYAAGLLGTLWSYNIFDVIWLFTGGGPVNSTQTLPVLVYERAFKGFAMGQASAISVLLSAFLLLFSVLYIKFVPAGETEGEVL